MKRILLLCFCVLVCQGCRQQGQPIARPHSDEETLEYLVDKADLIALVEVVDSFDATQGPPILRPPPSVKARILKLFKIGGPIAKEIKISRKPASVNGLPDTFLALGNGTNLIFVLEGDGVYVPVTEHAVITLNSPNLTPIWRRERNTDNLEWQPGITVDDVLSDLQSALPPLSPPQKKNNNPTNQQDKDKPDNPQANKDKQIKQDGESE